MCDGLYNHRVLISITRLDEKAMFPDDLLNWHFFHRLNSQRTFDRPIPSGYELRVVKEDAHKWSLVLKVEGLDLDQLQV